MNKNFTAGKTRNELRHHDEAIVVTLVDSQLETGTGRLLAFSLSLMIWYVCTE